MRRVLLILARAVLDLAVVAIVIACVLHFSRRRTVDCAWERMRASCTVETIDSLGRVEGETVEGIRSAAYRSGAVVGLVTDAQHRGEMAPKVHTASA